MIFLMAIVVGRVLSLDDAVGFALAHGPEAMAAAARVGAANAEAQVPVANWLPQLDAGAELLGGSVNQTTASFFSVPGVDAARVSGRPATATTDWRAYPSSFAGLRLHQEIFDFGKYFAQVAAQDARVEVAKANARVVHANLRYAVTSAYFSVFAAKAVVLAAEEAYTRAEAHRNLAAAGVKAGMREPIVLARANADLSRFDSERIRARGALQNARVALAAAIGSPDEDLDVTDAPPPLPVPPTPEQGMAQALANEPSLRAAAASLRAATANTRSVTADYFPELALQGFIGGDAGGAPGAPVPPSQGWLPSVANYAVAVTLRIPLLDFQILAHRRVALAEQRVFAAELVRVTAQVDATVRNAYVTRDVAISMLPALEREVAAARANWAQADARFSAGIGTSVELADAEALREDSDIRLALGRFDIARSEAALRRAMDSQP